MQKSQSKQATCVNESVLCQLLKMMSLTKKGCEMFTGRWIFTVEEPSFRINTALVVPYYELPV